MINMLAVTANSLIHKASRRPVKVATRDRWQQALASSDEMAHGHRDQQNYH